MHTDYDVIIIGSGPAGLTSSIYAARALLSTAVITGVLSPPGPGGQLTTTHMVNNYPGIPNVLGTDLMSNMMDQAQDQGATLIEQDVLNIRQQDDGQFLVDCGNSVWFTSQALILTMGSTPKKLDIPGATRLWNKGVSSCAVCDGPLPIFHNGQIFVVGGGDSAMEEALFLSKFANQVHIIHRSNKYRASKLLEQQARNNKKIMFWDFCELKEIYGTNNVNGVLIHNKIENKQYKLDANGVFWAIGHIPNTDICVDLVELTKTKHIKIYTNLSPVHTSVDGVFAAGDVADYKYRQAITAAGTGCIASIEVTQFISSNQ